MKKLSVPFVLFFVFSSSTLTFASDQEQSWDLARIVSVEDGDTIKVRLEINTNSNKYFDRKWQSFKSHKQN